MVEVKEVVEKRGFPPGHTFGGPCKCRGPAAVGETKLRYVQPPRQPSYAPVRIYKRPDTKIPDKTTYNLSYEAFDPKVIRSCKGVQTIAKENLTTAGSFSGETTHKMSYGAWPGMNLFSSSTNGIVYPKDHRLMGEGPMSSTTTTKHDYTAKQIGTVTRVLPEPNLGFPNVPMENYSTMGLSYQCPDYNNFESPISYKPQVRYMPPTTPVDGGTVHKMSFLPWHPLPKEDLPWARKCKYSPPKEPLEATTVYNGSFIAPGQVVEDHDEGHCKGCYCMYQGECFKGVGCDSNANGTCPSGYNPNTDPPRPPPLINENAA